MKKVLIIIAALVIFIGIVYANNVYDHQVKQEVVLNEHTRRDYFNYPTPVFINYRRDDASIDSALFKEAEAARAVFERAEKNYNAPYKLTTSYNHYTIEDFGTAREIDSIKCIRYNEMLNLRSFYDTKDSLIEVVKDKEEAAKDFAEKELERLNKSCK